LITGVADDDPSGIATYSQAGAQFGYQLGWVMLFSYPLMAVTQVIAARIGAVTGLGIASNLKAHYPPWLLRLAVFILVVANVANLGADLGAMASALTLLIGGPGKAYTVGFALICVVAEIRISYARYAAVLKWLTLSLFTYVGVVFAVHVPWGEALRGALIPHLALTTDAVETLVAILGTTISPYLFFWQASEEVEELRARRQTRLLDVAQPARALARIDLDTWVGMGYSNLIALFIIIATAATLHASGITTINTASEAAEALRPIGGAATFWLFATGIIGTGLLAVPVLAGSAAYAVTEMVGVAGSLDAKPLRARLFYATIAVTTMLGAALNYVGMDPARALYWAAVVNGVLAAPLMAVMMLIVRNPRAMGRLTLGRNATILGWAATATMAAATIVFFVTL
jgi:NRAMP (natural resistance-associated macrophage protein)-like metal ion transporter